MRPANLFLLAMLALFSLSAGAADRVTYFVPDAQGSSVAAMDEQGNVLWRETYAPYGERKTRPSANNAKPAYTGKPEDPDTGLVYMGARMYDPETARFTGIDPQGFGAGNPQSFGRYVYANNSPYKYTDPDGEAPSPVELFLTSIDGASFAWALAFGTPMDVAEAGADLKDSLKGLAIPIPGAGIALKLKRAADAAEKAEGTGRVFWSGGQKAKDAARAHAEANGKTTLEMTERGRALEGAGGSMPREELRKAWQEASSDFATGANGPVDVFVNQDKLSPTSIWSTIEKPTLMQSVDVTKINYVDVQ